MTVCSTCRLIPFRQLANFRVHDRLCRSQDTLGGRIAWRGWRGSPIPPDILGDAWIRLNTIGGARQEMTCSLCDFVYAAAMNMQGDGPHISERKHVWLQMHWPGDVQDDDHSHELRIGDSLGPEPNSHRQKILIRTMSGSVVRPLFGTHLLYTNPLNHVSLARLGNWLETCSREHTLCSIARAHVQLPTRLISLHSLPDQDCLLGVVNEENAWRETFLSSQCKLIENDPGTLGRYATLSYCWGPRPPYITTTSNLESHRNAIEFRKLPRTLQDAIMVARFLEFDYIWIDCICIIQNDREDWAKEAARMADVYSNASLCISASRAAHCDEGFLGDRDWEPWHHVLFEDCEGSFDLYFFEDESQAKQHRYLMIPGDPLELRGWVFQERLLSPRTMFFSHQKTTWECSQVQAHEDGSSKRAENSRLEQIAEDILSRTPEDFSSEGAWLLAVREYSTLTLSNQSDKLPAFSGVVTRLQQLTGGTNYAGLWEKSFLVDLLWRRMNPEKFAASETLRNWRAPSWSFAATDGGVDHDYGTAGSLKGGASLCAELQQCILTPVSSNNPLGELKDGFARIRGPVTSIIRLTDLPFIWHGYHGSNCQLLTKDMQPFKACVAFDYPPNFASHLTENAGPAKHNDVAICDVLMVTPLAGLAIQATDATRTTYTRVGLVTVWQEPDHWDVATFLSDAGSEARVIEASDYPEPQSIVLI